MHTIATIARRLAKGETTSLALTAQALARAADAAGEGGRVFTVLFAKHAMATARQSDADRAKGLVPSPLAGIPLSIKDLFDVAGIATTAGSIVLREAPPAAADAVIVSRLRAAGAIIVGRTTMTEFAYSGLGLNPHYGTPRNAWDRATGRVPGGSSSGAAISVTDGMVCAAIGTDTGGSVRIPAAANGITGFKPTQRRVPLTGTFPLSHSLDFIGPLAPSVTCCALLDAVLAGMPASPPVAIPAARLRLAVPRGSHLFTELEGTVSDIFERALDRLTCAGVQLVEVDLPALAEVRAVNRRGGISGAESYALHRVRLAAHHTAFDPRVAARLVTGAAISAADYAALLTTRREIIGRMEARLSDGGFDGWIAPTLPCVPQVLAQLEADDEAYNTANLRMLRNTAPVNFLDGCAISLPCHDAGEPPVGLMLAGPANADARILAAGLTLEGILSPGRFD